MSGSLNPYQSPTTTDPAKPWWTRLFELFRPAARRREPVFADGDAIICAGIAFFIEPGNNSILYAASPSSDHSDQRLNLIVAETIRVLPMFVADYPHLQPLLAGRKLCIRMVDSYTAIHAGFHREYPLQWDVLHAVLDDDLAGR